MSKLKIVDGSDDKKYFTIIPNIIVNGSNHWEQSLYLVMKRIAGENGECYASVRTLAKKMDCSTGQISKTIKSLLKRGWIEFVGTRKGKTSPVKCYRIIDLWQKNIEMYSKEDCSHSEHSLETVHIVNTHRSLYEQKNNNNNNNIYNIYIRRKQKKYSSLKDIKEEDLIEIAEKYKVGLGFVKLQFEKLKNYCEAKGRKYKNYKSALRNFVLGDIQRNIEKRQNSKYRPVDARDIE